MNKPSAPQASQNASLTKNTVVSVALVSNQNFAPILYTCVQSIIMHTSPERTYDICILHPDIDAGTQQLFLQNLSASNIQITFFDVNSYISDYRLNVYGHFSSNTFYRFLIPEIFTNCKKVLYLDCDIIVCDDLAELYDTELGDHLLAAVSDADYCGSCNKEKSDSFSYAKNILHMENPFLYFQAGVLLMNTEKLRSFTSYHELFTIADSYSYRLFDQDILNMVCYGQVLYIDMKWNLVYDYNFTRIRDIISLAPDEIREQYTSARKAPSVIHYAGPIKPWMDPSVDFGYEFWKVAKTTPFFELLLNGIMQYKQTRYNIEHRHFFLKCLGRTLQHLIPKNTRLFLRIRALYSKWLRR